MKKILLILSTILFVACDGLLYSPVITNTVFNPSTDSLYAQCKELKGLGPLHIGETTLRQVKKDKGITLYDFQKKPTFVGGYWGASSFENELGKYLDKEAKTIKQYKISDYFSKYKIGELEVRDVCLAFYKDTLVAISFDCEQGMLEHYIKKYGNGKGNKYEWDYRKGEYGDKDFSYEYEHIENRLWANEHLQMEFKRHSELRKDPEGKLMSRDSKSCVISSNSRYNDFLTTLEKYKAQYKEEKTAQKQKMYDGL